MQHDYFQCFGLPRAFSFEGKALRTAYEALQQSYHPDRMVGADPLTRRLSLQMSTYINDAYRTLQNPLLRARYLLQLAEVSVDMETDTQLNPDFLEKQLEWHEKAAASTHQTELLSELQEEQALYMRAFEKVYTDQQWDVARRIVREWQCVERLLEKVTAV